MPGRTKPHAHNKEAPPPSAPEAVAHLLGARLRQVSFGLVLLGAGVGPLAPTLESTLSLRLIAEFFFILAGALWLASQALDGRLRLVTGRVGVGLIFLVGALLCATVNAVYTYPALLTLLSWLSAVIAFLVVLNECQSRDRRLMLFLTLAAGVFITSLHGLHQLFVELPGARQAFSLSQATVLKQLNIPADMAQDFAGRLDKDRIFSTFLIANSFAGFLVLMIPALLGYLADGWRRMNPRQTVLTAILLLPILIAFAATGSKGGAVALGVGLVVFTIWAFGDFILRRRMQFACAAIAILVVLGIAQLSGLLPRPSEYAGSSSVRYGYWRAAVQIFRAHPAVGVGLDNFADQYAAAKRPEDQEVRRTHNDYLQLLAEGGVLLLAAYACFLVLYWRRVARRRAELIRPADPLSTGVGAYLAGVIPLGAGIFVLEMLCGGTLQSMSGFWGWYWPMALWFAWTIFMAVCFMDRSDYALGRSSRATIGIACGLIAFFIHSLGDFDHFVPGTLLTAWLLMALLLAARQSEETGGSPAVERRLNPLARLACVLLPSALALMLLYGFVTGVIESGLLVESARDFTSERSLEQRRHDLETASARNPWDAHTQALLSDVVALMWSRGQANTAEGDSTLSKAIVHAQEAANLDPARSEYYKRLGRLYEARWLQKRDAEDFRRALVAFAKAEELFPSNPETALDRARLFDETGQYELAQGKYLSALALSKTLQYHATRRFTEGQTKELGLRINQLMSANTAHTSPPPLSFKSARLRGWPGME